MLLQIFNTFFRIGLFTFGGGYAMLPIIEHDIVCRKQWLSEEQFLDLFSIAQTLPGVFAVNISVFVGYRLKGFWAGIIAALGAILPSFFVMLVLALFFEEARDNEQVLALFRGIRPAVVALIAIPIYTTWKKMRLSNSMLIIPILSALAVWIGGLSPIVVIFIAALGGILYGMGIKPYLNKTEER